MKPPRGLSAGEAQAWARLAATVRPLDLPVQVMETMRSVVQGRRRSR
jgi:hypothetical protein